MQSGAQEAAALYLVSDVPKAWEKSIISSKYPALITASLTPLT